MKVTLSRSQLYKALGPLVRIVERRNTIPILSNLAVSAEGGRFSIIATDLDIEAATSIDAEVGQPGATTLPANTLHDIVRKLPDGSQVILEASEDGTRMALRSGRSRFTLQTLPERDFPRLGIGDLPHSFALPADRLREWTQVTFAISTEETRYYLNGVYLHIHQEAAAARLRSVTTDGHRLVRLDMPLPDGAAGMPGVIVPRKTVTEVIKLAEASEGDIVIGVSAGKIRFAARDTVLTSKLVDGTYPDYARVIPSGNTKIASFDRAALTSAVDRVTAIGGERGRAVKIGLADGRCTLSSLNPDIGDATDEIDAAYDADPFEIGFNGRYVADVLGAVGGETVDVALGEPSAPVTFASPTRPELLVVLMPMRV